MSISKILIAATVWIAAIGGAYAQKTTLNGKVTDGATGEPIIGATVVEANTVNAAATDFDGNFTITVKNIPATLTVDFVGYRHQEVKVYDPEEEVEIYLSDNADLLSEVVVTGYSQVKRSSFTGAVNSVDGKDLKATAATSFTEQLQGQSAGLIVTGSSGAPGSGVFLRLRGSTSINAGNDPLYIIDGIPFNSQSLQTISIGGQTTNPLSDINPNDIEKVEILKDATATAIYGSRGANGVILITTKRGEKETATKINVTAEYGLAKAAKLWNLATGPETAQIINEAWINDGKDPNTVPYRSKSEGGLGTPQEQPTYNRIDVLFRTAKQQNYSASLSGGNKNTTYFLGVDFNSQEAIVKTQDFQRFGFRFNLDHEINKYVTISTSNALSRTRRSLSRTANSPKGILQAAVHQSTILNPFNEDGSYARYGIFDNIYAIIENNNHHAYGLRDINNINIKFKLAEGLSFKSSYGIDYNDYHEKRYFNTELADGQPDGSATDARTSNYTFTAEQLLNFYKDFTPNQFFSAFLGNSVQKNGYATTTINGSGFPSDSFEELGAASVTSSSTSKSRSSLISWFLGLNYSLFDRYSLEANVRADASSRFGSNNRWGVFPSVGAAWVVSKEAFAAGWTNINALKVKGSIGLTGNQSIDDFASRGLWDGSGVYNDQAGLLHTQLANDDLKWETTRQWNIGIETGLLNNRLSVEFNYYNKYTTDLLLETPIPAKTGFSSIYSNLGEMSNKGIELQISSTNIKNEDFEWTSSFNITHNSNKIEKMPVAFSQYDRDWVLLEEGKPLYSFWLYKQLRVDPQTGDAVYEDVNHDGKINTADRQIVGDAWPDFTGGLRNTLKYKNLDLSFLINFSVGNDVFNMNRFFQEHGGVRGTNWGLWEGQMDRWTKPGDITDIPRAKTIANADGSQNNGFQSSRFLEDGSFARIKSLSLGYTLPKNAVAKAGFENVRVYFNVTNLVTWTGYSGADPETNAASDYSHSTVQGLDFALPPQPRTFSFGISANL